MNLHGTVLYTDTYLQEKKFNQSVGEKGEKKSYS